MRGIILKGIEMTELTKEQMQKISKEASLLCGKMGAMLVQEGVDQRIALVASIRCAAGLSVTMGIDLHSAMSMFMAVYKDADEFMDRKLKGAK